MSRKVSLGAAVSAAAIAAAVAVSLTYRYSMGKFNAKVADVNERQAMYTKLSEIDQKARQDYVGKIDESALTDGICAGYLAGLGDSHAQYLSPKKYRAYLNATDDRNIGVGIQTVRDSDGNMEIIEVTKGSPAEKSGIKKGDTIVAVDGKDVVRSTYAVALNMLEGSAGTKVRLKILRLQDGSVSSASQTEPLEITVTRGEYRSQTVQYSMVNGNAAYIKISRFDQNTATDFNNAVSTLIRRRAAGIVIDLRGNSGANVETAASVLDTLLPAGNTVISRGKDGRTQVEYTSHSNEVEVPLGILINNETSGAAEIFAADIRDFKKGLLVGEKTAGNAVKTAAVPLSDGSAMILSVADYLTVGGKDLNGAGVAADINISLGSEQKALLERNSLSPSKDAQVQAAVSALIRQGASVQQSPGVSSSASGTD